jgi:hypothetical protein
MKQFLDGTRFAAAALFGLLLLICGCGGGARSDQDLIPAEAKARTALETVLTAWQNGQAFGPVAIASGTAHVVDSEWKAGKKLAGYEIVSAEPAEGPPRFAVKLRVQAAPGKQPEAKGEREVRYVVVGIDPLWIYREDEYQSTMGMN